MLPWHLPSIGDLAYNIQREENSRAGKDFNHVFLSRLLKCISFILHLHWENNATEEGHPQCFSKLLVISAAGMGKGSV